MKVAVHAKAAQSAASVSARCFDGGVLAGRGLHGYGCSRPLAVLSLLLGLMSGVSGVQAAGSAQGTITSINVRETGAVEFYFAAAHANADNCLQSSSVVVPPTHAAKREILAVAMSAYATGSRVNFWVSGCTTAYGTSYPTAWTIATTR